VPAMLRGAADVYEYPMIDRDPVPTWVDGKVALLGDAAHVMYPTGSNGGTQAIVDARVLGAAMLAHGVTPAALQDYDGTLLLVSHDRAFLDNVVTQTVAAEGGGRWHEYPGGYTDWLRQSDKAEGGRQKAEVAGQDSSPVTRHPSPGAASGRDTRVKLNNKEARELAALPGEISALEAEQSALAARMVSPDYFRQSPGILRADKARTAEIEERLIEKLERWEALEAMAQAAAERS